MRWQAFRAHGYLLGCVTPLAAALTLVGALPASSGEHQLLNQLRRQREARYAALGAGVIFKRDRLDWELNGLEGFHRQLLAQADVEHHAVVPDEILVGRWRDLRNKAGAAIFGARALIWAYDGHRLSGAIPRVAYRSIFEDWARQRPWPPEIRPSLIPESGSGITSVYQVQLLREYEREFDRCISRVTALNAELRQLLRDFKKAGAR